MAVIWTTESDATGGGSTLGAVSDSTVRADGAQQLPLTGERTVPGIAEENYWFRRHEVVYRDMLQRCADRTVLEAGAGEGYGADMIADVATRVIGLDYDESAVAHIRARYPRVDVRQATSPNSPSTTHRSMRS